MTAHPFFFENDQCNRLGEDKTKRWEVILPRKYNLQRWLNPWQATVITTAVLYQQEGSEEMLYGAEKTYILYI